MKFSFLIFFFSLSCVHLVHAQSAAVYGGNFGDGDYTNNATITEGNPNNNNIGSALTQGNSRNVNIVNPNAPGQILGFFEVTYLGGAPGVNNSFDNLQPVNSPGGPTNPDGLGARSLGLRLNDRQVPRAGGRVRVRLFITNNRTTFNGLSLISRAGVFSPNTLTIESATILGQNAMAGAAGGFSDGNRREILNYVDDASGLNGANDIDDGPGTATGLINDGINATNTPAFTTPAVSAQNDLSVGDTLEFLRRNPAINGGAHINEWAVNLGLDWGGGPSRYSFGEVAEITFAYTANTNGVNGTNVVDEFLALTFDVTVAPEPSSAMLAILGAALGFAKRRRLK